MRNLTESLVKINVREWFAIILCCLFLTDLSIILNIPYLREALSFLFFTLVPGILIVQILRLERLDFITKTVLWIGISLATLMFAGLFLNSLYPYLLKPLSLIPVLILLNVIVLILSILSYKKTKDDFKIQNIFNFKLDISDKLVSTILFPLIFPILAILGTALMNFNQNNTILMALLFLIPLYTIILIYLDKKVHRMNYPIAIWSIGISLLLMHSLTSNHIIGRDVHVELYTFQLTLADFHWNIKDFYNPYNACLSINILPSIYHVLSNMIPEYIFKLFFGIIGSFIPLIIYQTLKKYLTLRYAFIGTLLLVFQAFFINLTGCIRQEVAILFFFLAVLVLFQKEFTKSVPLKVLFLIFVFSMIMSHYATSYVALALFIPILLIPFLRGIIKERKINFVNFDVILPYILFLAIWFILIAKVQFEAGSEVIGATVAATADLAKGLDVFGAKETTILNMLGIGLKSLPNTIAVLINDVIFLVLGLGFLRILFKKRYYREKLETGYILGAILSLLVLAAFVFLPYVSYFYGPDRLFFQLLIFTSALFVIGCTQIAKTVRMPKLKTFIMVLLLLSLFTVTTHLQYHYLGTPFSVEYDNTGIVRSEFFIYDGEVSAAKWININKIEGLNVTGDAISYSRLLKGDLRRDLIKGIDFNKPSIKGYLFLGKVNTNDQMFFENFELLASTDKYSHFFNGKSKIFSNGIAELWF